VNKFGLTTEEASKALSEQGNNALTQPPRETFWDKLWENFKDPIIRILILALLVNVVFVYMGHGDWIETMGIFLAIILATFVSTYSEYSNENAFQKLQEEASRIRCKVWRDGEPVELHIDDIVVGDAVILEAGDKVPVDGILLDGDVKLDQAALNGESKEAHKLIAPILPGAMVLSIFWTSISCSAAASLSKVRASCRPLRSATALSTVS